ncbi:unnamed protein product [Bathycoccus prasinos]|jgi:hypothetical protein
MGKSFAHKKRNKRRREREKEENERLQRLRGIDEEERRGNVLLWDLIVNNDDICFKHIIPRLDSNDVKFFYEVNSETSKLIKRSSRERDLKKWFHIEEMSSISTLEVAWKHYSWGDYDHDCDIDWDEPRFCSLVAKTNKLELLKWARREKKCDWDHGTIDAAAEQGNLEMVKYCVVKKCPFDARTCACAAAYGHLKVLKYLHEKVKAPWDSETAACAAEHGYLHILEYLVKRKFDNYNEDACASAAIGGHLEVLKYLHEEVKAPWDSQTANWAAHNGHLHILEYLVERKFDQFDVLACRNAAMYGHLDCLKYLRETAKVPWNSGAFAFENCENDHPECVRYLLDNNCPLPPGWRYEDGTLRTSYNRIVNACSDTQNLRAHTHSL